LISDRGVRASDFSIGRSGGFRIGS
jgi:hypothetical protein